MLLTARMADAAGAVDEKLCPRRRLRLRRMLLVMPLLFFFVSIVAEAC